MSSALPCPLSPFPIIAPRPQVISSSQLPVPPLYLKSSSRLDISQIGPHCQPHNLPHSYPFTLTIHPHRRSHFLDLTFYTLASADTSIRLCLAQPTYNAVPACLPSVSLLILHNPTYHPYLLAQLGSYAPCAFTGVAIAFLLTREIGS